MTAFPEWSVESLRCTSFFADPPSDVAGITWWEDVVGAEPSDVALRPHEGVSRWSGAVEWPSLKGATLDLEVHPPRANWHLRAAPEPDEPLEFMSIGTLPVASEVFRTKLATWFPNCPTSIRLAYGGVVHLPSGDLQSAYGRLSKFLTHVRIDPEGSRDLLYRINRRRPSTSLSEQSLEINRISTWAVVSLRSLLVTLPDTTLVSQEGGSAARLEFDMNTVPRQGTTIPSEKLAAVIAELADLSIETASEGDIP